MDISLVTYRSAPHLPALIASLAGQKNAPEFHLWIHDNASGDDTLAVLEEELKKHPNLPRAHITRSLENLGFGTAHNRNLAHGRSEILLLLNPDCVLPEDALRRFAELPAQSPPSTAAWEARQAPYEHPKPYDPLTGETPWCSAACLLLRRAAFEAVSGFDPALFLYGEDVDLSFRLRAAGYGLRYVPSITILHHSYRVPGERKPAAFFGAVRAMLFLRARYGGWRARAAALPLWAAAFFVPRAVMPARARGLWRALRDAPRPSRLRITPAPAFRRLDVTPRRSGAFHDITQGLAARDAPCDVAAVCAPENYALLAPRLAAQLRSVPLHGVAWDDLPSWLAQRNDAWIWFLDAAAVPFPDMAEQMAALAQQADPDILLCDAQQLHPPAHGLAYALPRKTFLARAASPAHPLAAFWFRRAWLLSLPAWPSSPSLLTARACDAHRAPLAKTLIWHV